jgi:hypothetical protein
MQCPKCGSSQPVTNKECASCGIIFDRWQPRVTRPTTASSRPVPTVEREAPSPSIPNSLVAAGLVVIVIIGFVWTKRSRESRPKNNTDEIINQINNSGAKLRSDLQNKANRGRNVAQASAMSSASKLPADLDESKIRDIIESCSFFQSDVSVDIPKRLDARSYSLGLNRAAAVGIAARDHLIEFDPPIDSNLLYGEPVNVKVTQYASSKVTVIDNGDSYRFGLGRRHVNITSAYKVNQGVTATFTWTLDQSDAADLAPEGPNPAGGADLQHTASGWNLTRAWQKSAGITRYICQ